MELTPGGSDLGGINRQVVCFKDFEQELVTGKDVSIRERSLDVVVETTTEPQHAEHQSRIALHNHFVTLRNV